MLKIRVDEDCGNAPKMALLRDFNIAFAQGDKVAVLQQLASDIRWEWVGDKVVEGKEQVAKELDAMLATKTSEIILQTIMSHGKVGAIDGRLTLENGESYAFSDIYRFTSNAKEAKIKEIMSYVIKIEP